MADPSNRSSWRDVLDDRSVLAAIAQAARTCTRDGCAHEHRDDDGQLTDDPSYCNCTENLMNPIDFVQWLEGEIRIGGRGQRIEPAGRPNRERENRPLLFAVAG